MDKPLRAVVVGAGFAGEGHTLASRYVGVDVVAICARQPEIVRAVAERLDVPEASTDWRSTLHTVKPDIVSIATPASVRGEVVEAATAMRCHILCDKPLATTGDEAERLVRLVDNAGVKHAYAATHRYEPSAVWLGELVRDGAVGTIREIVETFRFSYPPLTPWSWMFSLAAGGGLLNNGLSHFLGILAVITGGQVRRVMGQARVVRDKAPVVPNIHDNRALLTQAQALTADEAAGLEWRACDAEEAFSALLMFETPTGEIPVCLALGPGTSVSGEANGMRLYGDAGTLVADGLLRYTVSRVRSGAESPEPLPVPQRLLDELPQVGDHVQNKWCALARDFVASIRGEAHRPYLTFRDGWIYQVAFDAIRSSGGWTELPA